MVCRWVLIGIGVGLVAGIVGGLLHAALSKTPQAAWFLGWQAWSLGRVSACAGSQSIRIGCCTGGVSLAPLLWHHGVLEFVEKSSYKRRNCCRDRRRRLSRSSYEVTST